MATQLIPPHSGTNAVATKPRSDGYAAASAAAWKLAAYCGLGFVVIGWTDVLLGLYPFQVGNPDWEFGGISSALNSMPLGTLGFTAATISFLLLGWHRALRIIALSQILIAVLLVSALVLYSLSIPAMGASLAPPVRNQLFLAAGKAILLGITYLVLHVVMFRAAWRGAAAKNRQ